MKKLEKWEILDKLNNIVLNLIEEDYLYYEAIDILQAMIFIRNTDIVNTKRNFNEVVINKLNELINTLLTENETGEK